MREVPDPVVVRWLDEQPTESIWTTAVTVFEIRFGIDHLPAGRRRRRLEEAFGQLLAEDLDGRIQTFDATAAQAAGVIAADLQRSGQTVEIRDVQIAGIARSRRATVATGNRRHFDPTGVDVVDPWAQDGRG